MVSADVARNAVGILGNVISFGLFLSPLPTFWTIWRRRSVEEFSALPYLATLLNCLLWCLYGLPLVHPNSTLVITINGSGLAIELAYLVLYLAFSDGRRKAKVAAMLAGEVIFVAGVAAVVLRLVHTHEKRSMVVGSICVVFGTLMYVAPLSVMKLVIKSKSIEYMPLSLSLASFLNGVCWTAYALIRFDLFITIPNGLGILFATAQLLLYAAFYKSTQRQIAARKCTEVEIRPRLGDMRVSNTNENGSPQGLPEV